MIAAMLNVEELRRSILVVALEQTNVERMRLADPVTLESIAMGGVLQAPAFPENFSILIAYEEDSEAMMDQVKVGGMEFLRWLERGRRFDPAVDGKEKAFRIQMAPREPE